ncbi:flagellar biosynthesis protein FlgB [Brevirhabdus pacifica]|uniref:Flagellar basal body rod protein FlgB n=1 Tax=Brevirhabdus pacifica TaxID=1267768 RepID=A0A1U7DH31_9RHOB|nr:flagellar basal body protein [Brevirhabdus pacifica]APX89188.1 flagellar biosynthesis protein FlgB [Brevirhabdus pacifica]OWU76760.1 flagellar basal-body rod protein FlgB [Loktanella sp. 22II-4b]PJJ86212.1 flagellar basal-body rod protein FlgB [Brevirhabdus pacifica]
MKLESMSFFEIASKRMQWLGVRQQVVAENVANADTPEYKARDVSPFAEMIDAATRGGGPQTTNPKHISSNAFGDGMRVDEDQVAWEAKLDGNTVVLEQQSIKAAEISENYRLASQLYRKGYELLTLSVTGGR